MPKTKKKKEISWIFFQFSWCFGGGYVSWRRLLRLEIGFNFIKINKLSHYKGNSLAYNMLCVHKNNRKPDMRSLVIISPI